MKVLLLDNYDSFVYNLKSGLEDLGGKCIVRRNDAVSLAQVRAEDPDAIIISPGPGTPGNTSDFGVCGEVLNIISKEVSTLGVCLGHQGIAHFYGGEVVRAPCLVHGKQSLVHHDGTGLYAGLPEPFLAGRYHSYMVSPQLPPDLVATSHTEDGVVMGLRHRHFPIEGVQFHPESVLTPQGKVLMENFLRGVRS